MFRKVKNVFRKERKTEIKSSPSLIEEMAEKPKKSYKRIVFELDEESAYKASIYALMEHVSRRVWIQNVIMEKLKHLDPINLKIERNEEK